MTATRRDILLAELRERAADRPAHAKALEQIIAWHEKWNHDNDAAPNDATDGMPRGVSDRVAIALDTDVYYAYNHVPGPTNVPPTRAYNALRHTDARAAAQRDVSRRSGIRELQNLMPFNPGATR